MKQIIYLSNPEDAKRWCLEQRIQGKSIGYVPTMGALHDGHLSLVRKAAEDNTVTCVSIFVNPLQFNDLEDLKNYPKNLNKDIDILSPSPCHMVYSGTLDQFFSKNEKVRIEKKACSPAVIGLESDSRPGHLEGVWTIMERLFFTVGSCSAYFGEKDFQQTLIMRDLAIKMMNDGISINVVTCPTVRETSGLAMSSRNLHLTSRQKKTATVIYRALLTARNAWHNSSSIRSSKKLQSIMLHELSHESDFITEYATVRDPLCWTQILHPDSQLERAQGMVAGYVGKIRLIDNLRLDHK